MSKKGAAFGLTLICAAGGLAANACAATATGLYVGAGAAHVELVQIAQTPDGRLAGRIEEVTLYASGDVQDLATAVWGAAEGRKITLSPISVLFSLNAPSATGRLEGDLLDLTWRGGHQVLQRADARQFEAAVGGLRARSTQIKAQREALGAARQREGAVLSLVRTAQVAEDRLGRLETAAARAQAHLSTIEDQYAALGAQPGGGQRQSNALLASARRPADAAILTMESTGLRAQVNSLKEKASGAASAARGAIADLELACRNAPRADERAQRACAGVGADRAKLGDVITSLQVAFEGVETSRQAALVQTGDQPRPLKQLIVSNSQ